MKSIRSLITIFLSVLLAVIFLQSVQAQTGNQSDTTAPDPQEFNNQSDTTANDPQEILNQGTNTNNNNSLGNSGDFKINREAFDSSFEAAGINEAINLFEESQAVAFSQYLGVNLFGEVATSQEISQTLDDLYRKTGKKAAIIYVVSLKDKLQLLLLLANNEPVRKVIPDANRDLVEKTAREFRSKITERTNLSGYQDSAQKLYQWIIDPLQSVLEANQIDALVFSMDEGLRSIPLAALYNGKQFLIEKYSVSIIPSFSLTDTRYLPISKQQMLAMGISKSTQEKPALP